MDEPKVKITLINAPLREETETLLQYFCHEIINAAALISFAKLNFEEQIETIKKVTKNWQLYSVSGYESQMWIAKMRGRSGELEDIRADYRGNSHLTDEEKSQLEYKYNEIIAKELKQGTVIN